jgi:adenylosuccinate lyase
MARLLRTNHLAALENVALWHERDISHSSVERVILPDSTTLLHYMLRKAVALIDGLRVFPERMEATLESTGGLYHSGSVLLALARKGLTREDAYRIVQNVAMKSWEEGRPFAELARRDSELTGHLDANELDACFDRERHLAHVDEIFDRVLQKSPSG